MITCPDCGGQKYTEPYICGRGYTRIKCNTCRETGEITEEHLHRITFGKRMRRERVDVRSMTMRKEAERLGCELLEWNAIEHGEIPKTEAGLKALAIRQQELSNHDATSSV